MKRQRLTGLIAAPFTAMKADGTVNLDRVEPQAARLAESGASGAFVCGTTGEGSTLTREERFQLAEKWVETRPKDLRIVVHVGHQSVRESRVLAAHAASIRADAFAAIGPTFHRASSLDQLVSFCVEVAAGAPDLPFYYYHFPGIAGADFPMADFLRVAGKRIPNLAGIKFTHDNLMDFSRCVHLENGRFDVLFGRDEMLLGALAMGAQGAVGSTYNYMAPIYCRMIKAFQSGDLKTAQKLQLQAIEVIAIMISHGGLPAGKAMMKLVGVDCGSVRTPLQGLSEKSYSSLVEALKAAGFPAILKGRR